MLICIDIFSCQFLNLPIKPVWVIVIVGFGNLRSYKFHQYLFCVLLLISWCMCVVLPLFVFLGGYIVISIVLLFVVSSLAMQEFLIIA